MAEPKKNDTLLAYVRENPPTVTSVSIDATKLNHLSQSGSNDIFGGMSKQDALPVVTSKNGLTE